VTPRPCLGCGRVIPSGSRCPACQRPRARATQRDKRQRRPYTTAEKRRRAAAVTEWVSTHGQWCAGWQGREPHAVVWPNVLTADHVVPVAAGGDEGGPLLVRCRACNSSRGARP
jgi:5-methylcytosine-specific restriction enzyme A